jgi:Protein of unknown function (DUF642)/PEP-CTERM motif
MPSYKLVSPAFVAMSLLIQSTSAYAAELVTNGGFEDPVVANPNGWDVYASIPGWTIVTPMLRPDLGIEVWRGVNGWLPAAGQQNLELDSDHIPPDHGPSSIAIYQDLSTTPGGLYNISFAFSPRPGVADNQLLFSWDGSLVDTLSADGSSLSQTSWATHSYQLQATGAVTRISFGDGSYPDSFGTLLDSVSVSNAVPEPSSLALVAVSGLAVLGINRRRSFLK